MSSSTGTWSVRSAGRIAEGKRPPEVVSAFAGKFSIPEEKALKYLQPNKLIKKGLSENAARVYQQQLNALGLVVVLQDANQPGVSITPEPEATIALEPVSDAPQPAALAAEPVSVVPEPALQNESAVSTVSPANNVSSGFSCPKCQLEQTRTKQCEGCGIFFDKLEPRQGAQSRDSAQERVDLRAENGSDDEADAFPMAALAAAAGAALGGALLWKFIAMQFDLELGLIAWGIGGAIGFAAAALGGRGNAMGACCAMLVVLSIFGGKYLYISSYMDMALGVIEDSSGQDWVDAVYSEIDAEREAFAAIPKDDNSIRQFMIDYDYTEATKVALVPPDDLDYFNEEFRPWLEMESEDEAAGDAYGAYEAPPEFGAAFDDFSVTSLVIESLGPLDLLFLFFGISTAFRLAQQGSEQKLSA